MKHTTAIALLVLVLAALVAAQERQPAQPPPPARWEYCYLAAPRDAGGWVWNDPTRSFLGEPAQLEPLLGVPIDRDRDGNVTQTEILNALGANGWELVCTAPADQIVTDQMWFKRPAR